MGNQYSYPEDKARGMRPAAPTMERIADLGNGTTEFVERQNRLMHNYAERAGTEGVKKEGGESLNVENIKANIVDYGNPNEYDSDGRLKVTAQKAREWVEKNRGRKSW